MELIQIHNKREYSRLRLNQPPRDQAKVAVISGLLKYPKCFFPFIKIQTRSKWLVKLAGCIKRGWIKRSLLYLGSL